MIASIFIETSHLRLRRFGFDDLPRYLAYRNEPNVARYQSWEQTSDAEARTFIQEQQQLTPGQIGQWFQFAIELKTTAELIGDCGLGRRSDEPRQATIGYSLASEYQGYGYATEAVRAVLDYSFTTLNLHRISAVVDCRNQRSAALLQRVGMRREAHLIECSWFKGEWSDEYHYALLQREWTRHKD